MMRLYRVPPGDFPEIERFRVHLNDYDFKDFAKLDLKMLEKLEVALTRELPKLMHTIDPPKQQDTNNPFDEPAQESIRWDVPQVAQEKFSSMFGTLSLQDGMLPGAEARQVLMTTGLDGDQLREIWALSDFDKKGKLDREEFILCMYLCHLAKKGQTIPSVLPERLIPPSKRM